MAKRKDTLPGGFKIGGINYLIVDDERHLRDVNAYGEIDFMLASIAIEPLLAPDRKGQVLTHEMVHAILYEAGLPKDIYMDEKLVDQIANVLFQVLKDNDFSFMRKL